MRIFLFLLACVLQRTAHSLLSRGVVVSRRVLVDQGGGLKLRQAPITSAMRLQALNVASTVASALSVAGVVAFHEAGHFLAARSQGMKVQSFNVGYGPKVVSFNDSSDTEFALRAIPLGGYVSFPSNVELNEDGDIVKELDDPDLLQNRPPLQRAWVISAGVVANILLTFMLATGTAFSSGLGHPMYYNGVRVVSMLDTAAAGYTAGIRVGDVITKVNGQELLGSEHTVEDFIKVIRASANQPVVVEIMRQREGAGLGLVGGSSGTTSITGAVTTAETSRQAMESLSRAYPMKMTVMPTPSAGGKGSVGLGINARVQSVETVKAKNLLEAFTLGWEETSRLFKFIVSAFYSSVTSGFAGSEVGGPISVVKAGAQMAETSPQALVGFAATLSVNLAIINALPFPALDGGQLAFVMIELLVGKPVPRKAKDAITAVAFSFLLVLGASTLLGDLSRIGDPGPVIRVAPKDNE